MKNSSHIFPPYSTLEHSMYATLSFFDLFHQPLTLEEIHHYLLGFSASKEEIRHHIVNHKKIRHIRGFYFLEGRGEIVAIREKSIIISQKLWKKVYRYGRFFTLVPFIKMVAVCNTLAFDSPTESSDIDLFIISKKGRIFTARVMSTLLFTMLGIRRHGKKIAGRLCLSFYVSESNLNLENIQNNAEDIYLAYWLLTLKPLYGMKTYESFLQANPWIKNYFPQQEERELLSGNEGQQLLKISKLFSMIRNMWERLLKGKLGNWLENHLREIHMGRFKKNAPKISSNASKEGAESSIVINDDMLKFHNIDRRKEFTEKFKRKMLKLTEK